MEYISKKLALKYLMGNEMIFKKIADSFLVSYVSWEEDLVSLIALEDKKSLEYYVHSLKGISLNLGAKQLYESAVELLNSIRKGLWEQELTMHFQTVLGKTYDELKSLQHYDNSFIFSA